MIQEEQPKNSAPEKECCGGKDNKECACEKEEGCCDSEECKCEAMEEKEEGCCGGGCCSK